MSSKFWVWIQILKLELKWVKFNGLQIGQLRDIKNMMECKGVWYPRRFPREPTRTCIRVLVHSYQRLVWARFNFVSGFPCRKSPLSMFSSEIKNHQIDYHPIGIDFSALIFKITKEKIQSHFFSQINFTLKKELHIKNN